MTNRCAETSREYVGLTFPDCLARAVGCEGPVALAAADHRPIVECLPIKDQFGVDGTIEGTDEHLIANSLAPGWAPRI